MYIKEGDTGMWECRDTWGAQKRVSGFCNYSDRQLWATWHGYWKPNSTPLQEQWKLLIPEHFSGHSRLFSTQKSGLLFGDDVISSPGEAKQKSSRRLLGLIWSCDLFTPTPYSDLHGWFTFFCSVLPSPLSTPHSLPLPEEHSFWLCTALALLPSLPLQFPWAADLWFSQSWLTSVFRWGFS